MLIIIVFLDKENGLTRGYTDGIIAHGSSG